MQQAWVIRRGVGADDKYQIAVLEIIEFDGGGAHTNRVAETFAGGLMAVVGAIVDVVEGLPLQNQSSVLEALNSFVDHDHTTQWLNTFNSNVHDDLDSIIENIIT